jgi:hypothetical protein
MVEMDAARDKEEIHTNPKTLRQASVERTDLLPQDCGLEAGFEGAGNDISGYLEVGVSGAQEK